MHRVGVRSVKIVVVTALLVLPVLAPGTAEDESSAGSTPVEKLRELARTGKYAEAITGFRALKGKVKKGDGFEYQQELAYALLEGGALSDAKKAFEEIVELSDYPEVVKIDARNQLESIMVEEAARKHEEGSSDDAAEVLLALKKKAGPGPFQFQEELARALLDARRDAEALQAFQEIISDHRYSEKTQNAAVREMRQMRLQEMLDDGYRVLEEDGPGKTAMEIALWLQEHFPTNEEAVAYRATYFGMNGQPRLAVGLLEKVFQDSYQDRPFPYAATLAENLQALGQSKRAAEVYAAALIDEPEYAEESITGMIPARYADAIEIDAPAVDFSKQSVEEELDEEEARDAFAGGHFWPRWMVSARTRRIDAKMDRIYPASKETLRHGAFSGISGAYGGENPDDAIFSKPTGDFQVVDNAIVHGFGWSDGVIQIADRAEFAATGDPEEIETLHLAALDQIFDPELASVETEFRWPADFGAFEPFSLSVAYYRFDEDIMHYDHEESFRFALTALRSVSF